MIHGKLKDLTVLITAAGSPGVPGLIRSLKTVDERSVKIVTSDIDEDAIGLFLAEKCYIEPVSSDPKYVFKILEICLKEKVDVVIPNTALLLLSRGIKKFEERNTKVLVSRNTEALERTTHKGHLFDFLKKNCLPVPEYKVVKDLDEFVSAVSFLGHPQNAVCFKPAISEGTRGFRILRSDINRAHLLFNEKPDVTVTTLEDIVPIFKTAEYFPNLVVMEYLPGKEYSVDLLLKNGEVIVTVPRYRKATKLGLSTVGIVEKNEKIVELSRKVALISGLDFNINIQIKYSANNEPKILEINPRVSGTLVLCTAANINLPYFGIKALLNEPLVVPSIKYGTKMIRFWSEVYINENGSAYTL